MIVARKQADDNQLVEMVRNGDQQAFREIVDRYRQRVAATVIGMLGKTPEADDAGQETFIRLYRSLERFRGDASLATYVTRIAINVALNEIRRRKRYGERFLDSELDEMETNAPAENSATVDQQAIIRKSLRKLDPEFRAVILLRIFEGLSTAETAEILEIPVGTVLSRLSRGQKKLKEVVETYLAGEV